MSVADGYTGARVKVDTHEKIKSITRLASVAMNRDVSIAETYAALARLGEDRSADLYQILDKEKING